MADEKRSHESEKFPGAIPTPAIAGPPKSRTRLRRVLLHLLTFGLLFFTIHRWYIRHNPEIEEEVNAWLSNPFSHRPGFPAHHRGRPILNGKIAQNLFLSVSAIHPILTTDLISPVQ